MKRNLLEWLARFDHVILRIIASYFHQKLTQTADIANRQEAYRLVDDLSGHGVMLSL
jgi:hypothetical protein